MGWWSTDRQGDSFADDGNNYVWGDGPADVLDDALHKICDEFVEAHGRFPLAGEIRAGLEFSLMKMDDREEFKR